MAHSFDRSQVCVGAPTEASSGLRGKALAVSSLSGRVSGTSTPRLLTEARHLVVFKRCHHMAAFLLASHHRIREGEACLVGNCTAADS